MSRNSRVLCISDTHIPYHHPDTLEFLKAVKKKYDPDRVIHLGDEVDHHALSFHDSDAELFSAGEELKHSLLCLKEFYKVFPKVDVMESNHGSLVYRRAKKHGVPIHYIKSYNEMLEAPKGWKWHKELIIKLSNGQHCYFCHGKNANSLNASREMSMNTVEGHYHNKFEIQYWSNPLNLFWGMKVGCSINDKSLAFAYNKNTTKRPLIGHAIIIDGQPKLLPIVLNKKGRWIGKVP